MQRENIEDMIGAGETIIVEWKPSLSQINEIINTIAAFANTGSVDAFKINSE